MTIQKLSEYKITRRDGSFINVECNTKIINTLVRKINTLVDVVNELQSRPVNVQPDTKSRPVNVQDKFAEQRKWVGKLCKVYDDNDFEHYAVLDEIHDDSSYCYGTRLGYYRHCEPVKPTDSIIYKGE